MLHITPWLASAVLHSSRRNFCLTVRFAHISPDLSLANKTVLRFRKLLKFQKSYRGKGGRKEIREQGLKQWKPEIIVMGARELHGHIKAESPGTVVKCSLKQEFSGNFPREPQPKPLTISRWKALNLQKTPLLSTLLFRGTFSLPEKVSNAAC